MSTAKEEKYLEMMSALSTFEQKVLEACEAMNRNGKVCEGIMGSDNLSKNSIEKMNDCQKKLHGAVTKSANLRKALSRDLETMRKIEQESRNF